LDVTDYFLHPALAPDATEGRAIVNAVVRMVKSFRNSKIKTLWVNVSMLEVSNIKSNTLIFRNSGELMVLI
jgi:nicotinamidase-related amidase